MPAHHPPFDTPSPLSSTDGENSFNESQPTKKIRLATFGDICTATRALDVQGLEQSISGVADHDAQLRLQSMLHQWQEWIDELHLPKPSFPESTLDLDARFPPGLPTCQSIDPTLRAANQVLDQVVSLYREVEETSDESPQLPGRLPPSDLLCFRPPERADLPVSMLCEAFGRYIARISSSDPLPGGNNYARDATRAASRLLGNMGAMFPTESDHSLYFNECLFQWFSRVFWKRCYPMDCDGSSETVNSAYFGDRNDYRKLRPYPTILREDWNESGQRGDSHMHMAHKYRYFVRMLNERATSGDMTAKRILDNGPTLRVSAGFFDGKSCIVEPLGPSASMLQDGTGTFRRRDYLARVLYALFSGARELENLVDTPAIARFLPYVPRIYQSYRAFDSNEISPLTLVSRIRLSKNQCHPFCKAMMTPPGSHTTESVVVKITDGPYGVEVQQALAAKGFAPILYGVSEPEGAPRAYVMEELKPNEWINLADFATTHQDVYYRVKPGIWRGLINILDLLESAGLVHGDMRLNNIAIKVNRLHEPIFSKKGPPILKIIDFDWSGRAGEVFYPLDRNPEVPWPDDVSGGPIKVPHDRLMAQIAFDLPVI